MARVQDVNLGEAIRGYKATAQLKVNVVRPPLYHLRLLIGRWFIWIGLMVIGFGQAEVVIED